MDNFPTQALPLILLESNGFRISMWPNILFPSISP